MKRELKFRAWDGTSMCDRVLPFTCDFVLNGMAHRCTESNGTGLLGSDGDKAKFEIEGYRFKEIMQFTGLKDKNGKEIYEGDILDASTLKTEIRGVMQWECERGEWTKFHPLHKFEVIGNIHQNPELL